MVRRVFAAGVLVVVAAFSMGAPVARAAAPADPRTEAAREHARQGDSYYKLEKYANAIAEYEQGYLAKPDPSFLFNIAQCHRLMGHGNEAIKFYRRFLNDAPPGTPSRGVAEKHIRDLEDAAKTGMQPPPVAAPAAPPPVAAPITPLPSASPPPPPPTGAGATTPVALGAANPTSPTSTTATVETDGGPASGESKPFYTKWWFWTAVGAVVVAGIIIGVAASGHDPSCPGGYTCP